MKNITLKNLLICLISVFVMAGCNKQDNSDSASKAATVEQAASLLNLENFDLIPGSQEPQQRNLAILSYQAAKDVNSSYEFYKRILGEKGWKELPNGYVTEQMASSVFASKGFKLSITIMPSSKAGFSDVMIQQHGNINLEKLPLAEGLKELSIFPQTAIYTSSSLPAETAETCKQKLLANGWVPYGSAGETQYYKQNAVLLKVTVSASPAEPGKTTVSLTDVLLSADIPVPAFAQSIDYKDSSQTLDFQSTESKEKIFDFYRQELLKGKWKLSDYQPGQQDGKDVLIFKSTNNDLLGVRIAKDSSGNNKVNISLQTGSQIQQINKKLDAQATAHYIKNNP